MFCGIAVSFIGGALFVLQQFSGINGVLYFSSLTFQDVGVSSSALASLFVGLTNLAGLHSGQHFYIPPQNIFLKTYFGFWELFIFILFSGALFSSYLVDRQGRLKLLIGSYLGMVSIYKMLMTFVYEISCEQICAPTHSLTEFKGGDWCNLFVKFFLCPTLSPFLMLETSFSCRQFQCFLWSMLLAFH